MRRILAVLAALVVLAAVAGAWTFHERYPRDEAGFLRYVRQYPGVIHAAYAADIPAATDAASQFTTPPGAMIAAGDRACHWLSAQPYAGLRTSASFRVSALVDRYVTTAPSGTLGWSGYPDSGAVTSSAWAYLCPGTMELHKPHWLFGAPSD